MKYIELEIILKPFIVIVVYKSRYSILYINIYIYIYVYYIYYKLYTHIHIIYYNDTIMEIR